MPLDARKVTEDVLALGLDRSFFEPSVTNLPPALMDDPYAFFESVRQKHGDVVLTDAGKIDGVNMDTAKYREHAPGTEIYLALGFKAAQQVLMNNATIFGQAHDHTFRKAWGDSVIVLDPPAHTPMRSIAVKSLLRIKEWKQEVIAPACEMLADRIEKRGGGDLVSDYTGIVPLIAVASILGLDMQRGAWVLDRINRLMAMSHDMEAGLAAAADFYEYFSQIYDERRANPGEDLISGLITAEADGEQLTKEQVLAFCRILLPGGFETTSKQFGHMLVALFNHPDQMAMVRADEKLLATAVEETTRWEAPLLANSKLARQDSVLDGVAVPKGSIVMLITGTANRDPKIWDQPDRFDVTRPKQATAAFGGGIHFCPGAQLARAEMEVGASVLLRRFPNLRLADPKSPPKVRGFYSRTVAEIPIEV